MAETILIAVDGSAASRAAAEVGLRLARADGASVVFFHADSEVAERLFEENPYRRDDPEKVMEADPVLREAADTAIAEGIPYKLDVIAEHGADPVADAIVGVAAAHDAGTIVVGSRGRGAVAGTILGSVSNAVMKAAGVRVLVVHGAEPGSR